MLKPSNQNYLNLLQEGSPVMAQVAWKGEDGEGDPIEGGEEEICWKGLRQSPYKRKDKGESMHKASKPQIGSELTGIHQPLPQASLSVRNASLSGFS